MAFISNALETTQYVSFLTDQSLSMEVFNGVFLKPMEYLFLELEILQSNL